MATIDLAVVVAELQDSSGAATTGGAMALLVADTSGGGMASLGNNLDPESGLLNGGFIRGGTLSTNVGFVVGKFTINASSATDGILLGETGSVALTSPLVAGQLLYLLWFPTLTVSSLSPGIGTSYGIFRDPNDPPLDGNAPWVIPADGQSLIVGARTPVYGGTTAQSLLKAMQKTAAFRITAIARESNNIRITWTMASGKNNTLERTAGTANGSYSNNFAAIFIVTNTVGTTTNYLDVGAVTNFPARYYRVRHVP